MKGKDRIRWETLDIDGMFYYPFNCRKESLEICGASFPNEKPLFLLGNESPLLVERPAVPRTLQSEYFTDYVTDD